MFTQATIKDVARAAGVHFSTVSLALHGHPAIAVKTRLRIESVAQLIGYRRNDVFSALSRQRKGRPHPQPIPTLLYLGRAKSNRHFFAIDHHRQLLEGATREAMKLGYQLRTRVVGPSGIFPQQLPAYLKRTTAAGVIIGAWDPTLEVPVVDWHRIPTVKIDSRHVPAQVPFVSFDQMKAVTLSFGKLRDLGYRRIGLALGEKDDDATDGLHLSGWLLAQAAEPNPTRRPPLFFPPGATVGVILPLLSAWIRQHDLDAVMCNWGSILSMLQMLKLPRTQPIGCVCLCRSRKKQPMAGIVPNLDLVGQRAVSLLGGLINARPEKIPLPLLTSYVEGTWHDGHSIKPQS